MKRKFRNPTRLRKGEPSTRVQDVELAYDLARLDHAEYLDVMAENERQRKIAELRIAQQDYQVLMSESGARPAYPHDPSSWSFITRYKRFNPEDPESSAWDDETETACTSAVSIDEHDPHTLISCRLRLGHTGPHERKAKRDDEGRIVQPEFNELKGNPTPLVVINEMLIESAEQADNAILAAKHDLQRYKAKIAKDIHNLRKLKEEHFV